MHQPANLSIVKRSVTAMAALVVCVSFGSAYAEVSFSTSSSGVISLQPKVSTGQTIPVSPTLTLRTSDQAPAYTKPVPTLPEAINSGRIKQEAVDIARQQGAAPVIIQLRLPRPYQPEYALNEAQIREQRQAIANAQSLVLRKLGGARVARVQRFRIVPYLALYGDTATLTNLVQMPEIARVMLDYELEPHLANSTPFIGASNVQNALGSAGVGMAVAILDTGVDLDHSFLSGSIVSEACYSDNGGWFSSKDSLCPGGTEETTDPGSGDACTGANGCDHGTHVAGIAAGAGASFNGVAPDASIIAIQVFHRENNANKCTVNPAPCVMASTSSVIKGLERVYELRHTFNIAAVNLSLGSGFYTSRGQCDDDNGAYRDIVDNLRGAQIATVSSSGNGAAIMDAAGNIIGFQQGIGRPACVSGVISVGATNNTNVIANFSQTASWLTLLAPGVSINSSVDTGGFGTKSGTSMAAPHVTGAFAVLKALAPQHSVAELRDLLITTGQPLTDTRSNASGAPSWNITTARLQLDVAVETQTNAPLTPSGLQLVSRTGTSLSVSWIDNARSEVEYELQAMPTNPNPMTQADWLTLGQNATGGVLIGLTPATQYEVVARACDAAGQCSPFSQPLVVSTANTLPAAPVNFRAGTVTATSIQVQWDVHSTNPITFFRIGSNTRGAWSSSTYIASARSTTFSNLQPASGYSFWIQACNDDGCSGQVSLHVNTPAIGTPPAAPTNLHFCGSQFMELCPSAGTTLVWDDNANNEATFEFQWWIAQPGTMPWQAFWNTVILTANRESYSLNNQTAGLLYYFRVRACNAAGCSSWSNMVSYTAP